MTHAIGALLYGVNAYDLDVASVATMHPGLICWGGDDTSRYNYRNGWTKHGSDDYFEKHAGAGRRFPKVSRSSSFEQFLTATKGAGAAAVGTEPFVRS